MATKKPHKIIEDVEHKHCGKCDSWLTLEQFSYSSKAWDNLNNHCKACKKRVKDQWYADNAEHSRAYAVQYRVANPDKIKSYNDSWLAANPDYHSARYVANKDEITLRNRLWVEANEEKHLAYNRAYTRQWRKDNPSRVKLQKHTRRQREFSATAVLTEQERAETLAHLNTIAEDTCFFCDQITDPMHVEHLTPLSRGGTNHSWNLVMSCQPCNNTKYTKTAEEFIGSDMQVCEI